MEKKTIEYYNFHEDLQPEILKNLNELLVAEGIEPMRDLHGGTIKDGKWVSVLESRDYRNYWHVYIELWGERIRNDSFDEAYFPHVDNDEEWNYLYERAEKFAECRTYEHSDPKWPRHLVTAMRKMIKDNELVKDPDGELVLIKWSW